ncbi:CBU_0592 family membrane protein [Maribellus luteus]|nr:hypothetical protein [Maribellus luteus]
MDVKLFDMIDFSTIGWLGAIIFVVAYLFLSIKLLSAEKVIYHILNALGGICLVINSVYLNDTPNLFVNAVWAVIAFFCIYKIIKTGFLSKRKANY